MNLEDGIRIFAENLYRSRGAAAEDYAKGRAADLARCGDWEGREVWTKVAATVRLLAADGAIPGSANRGRRRAGQRPASTVSERRLPCRPASAAVHCASCKQGHVP
jgi:hypothetical protein